MCGIVGYVGRKQAGPLLLDGLSRLEYRGYDSAGIAVFREDGGISISKAVGKLLNLIKKTEGRFFRGDAVSDTRAGRRTAPPRSRMRIRMSPCMGE